MRDAARDYGEARRGLELCGEARAARLVDLSALQVQALLGDARSFRASLGRLRRAMKEPVRRAVVEQAAGNGWRALGRERDAEACFRNALDRLGRRRDRRSRTLRALVRQDLGVARAYAGAPSEGVRLIARARDELAGLGLDHAEAAAAANLAWARGVAGDFAAACRELPDAADALARLGDRRRAALARLDAAEARRRLGDDARAARESTAAAAALRRAGLPAEEARARLAAARARAALGRKGRARTEARRAARAFEAAGDASGALEARVLAGDADRDATGALARAGRLASAVDAALERARAQPPARAVPTLERAEARLPPLLRPWLRPDRFRYRAQLEPGRRIAWLRRAVRAAERIRDVVPTAALRATSLARHLEIYEDLAAALLERGRARDRREAFDVLDAVRARTLREELERAAPGLGASPRVRRLRARLEELWRSLDARDRNEDGLRGSPAPILRDIRRLERELSEAWAETAAPASRPADSGAAGACLTFAPVGGRCVGMLAREGGVRAWDAGSMAARRRDLDAFLFQVRRRLHGAPGTRAADASLDRLAAALLPPGFDPPRTLRVVLPVELGNLPLESLPVNGERLVDRCTLSYAPCAAWRPRRRSRDGDAAVIGLAREGLPQIDREVEHVAELVSGRVVRDAARDDVLRALRGARLVHIAGHAETRDDAPPLSALRVRDGWLTAADLAGARTGGALVVLSACRTGDPALAWLGESLGGFPRALLAAGAAGVVASRWPVDDALAHAWMEAFYGALSEHGTAGAVRAAAIRIRQSHSHPADWAPFLFVPGGRG